MRAQIWEEHLRPNTGFGHVDRAAQYLRPELGAADFSGHRHRRRRAGDLRRDALRLFVHRGGHERERDDHRQSRGGHRELRGGVDRAAAARTAEKYMQQHRVHTYDGVNAFVDEGQGRLERRHRQHGAVGRARCVAAAPHAPRASASPCGSRSSAVPDLREPPSSSAPWRCTAPETTPRATSLQYGDHGDAMHFPTRGTVEVVGEDGRTIYATLDAGSFSGRARSSRTCAARRRSGAPAGMPGAVAGRPAASTESLASPSGGYWTVHHDQEAERGRERGDQPQPQEAERAGSRLRPRRRVPAPVDEAADVVRAAVPSFPGTAARGTAGRASGTRCRPSRCSTKPVVPYARPSRCPMLCHESCRRVGPTTPRCALPAL